MENFLPFTEDVMVVLVHKCAQQTHLLALHLETLGYIPRLLNALNGLVYFLIIGDPRGDNLMVGSMQAQWSLPVGFLLLRYSVLFTVESLFLLYLLVKSRFICSRRWYIDKLGVFHANQTSMCLDPHLKLRERLVHR